MTTDADWRSKHLVSWDDRGGRRERHLVRLKPDTTYENRIARDAGSRPRWIAIARASGSERFARRGEAEPRT